MTTPGKFFLLATTVILAALAAWLGWLQAWRYWPAPFAVPIVLSAALAAVRSQPSGEPVALTEPPAPPAQHYREVLDRDTSVANVPVPSASVNYEFLLSATIHWRPSPVASSAFNSASPATLARTAVIERASRQTGIEDPVDYIQAQHRLAAVLAVVQSDSTENLKVWATDVTLSMRPDDLDRLRRLDELNKQRELWEHKRAIEREVSTYFSEEVLKDPGTAVAWWMAKHHERTQEEIEHAVDLIGPLAQLAAAANNNEVPEVFRRFIDPPPFAADRAGTEIGYPAAPEDGDEHFESDQGWDPDTEGETPAEARLEYYVEGFLEQLGFASGSDERSRFTRQLAAHCQQIGKYEAAARIREAFDVGDFNIGDFNSSTAATPYAAGVEGPAEEASWQ